LNQNAQEGGRYERMAKNSLQMNSGKRSSSSSSSTDSNSPRNNKNYKTYDSENKKGFSRETQEVKNTESNNFYNQNTWNDMYNQQPAQPLTFWPNQPQQGYASFSLNQSDPNMMQYQQYNAYPNQTHLSQAMMQEQGRNEPPKKGRFHFHSAPEDNNKQGQFINQQIGNPYISGQSYQNENPQYK
jgi:hypothetical protein